MKRIDFSRPTCIALHFTETQPPTGERRFDTEAIITPAHASHARRSSRPGACPSVHLAVSFEETQFEVPLLDTAEQATRPEDAGEFPSPSRVHLLLTSRLNSGETISFSRSILD